MNSNISVQARVGHYGVCAVDRLGVQAHQVTKEKHCTCGGTAKRVCSHIKAVASYLREGGHRAPAAPEPTSLREKDNGAVSTLACPCAAGRFERRLTPQFIADILPFWLRSWQV